jgi:hypothetical protein
MMARKTEENQYPMPMPLKAMMARKSAENQYPMPML